MPLLEFECDRGHRFEDLVGGRTCQAGGDLPEVCPHCVALGHLSGGVRRVVSRCLMRFASWCAPLHSQTEEAARERANDRLAERVPELLDSGQWEHDDSGRSGDNMDGDDQSSSILARLENGVAIGDNYVDRSAETPARHAEQALRELRGEYLEAAS